MPSPDQIKAAIQTEPQTEAMMGEAERALWRSRVAMWRRSAHMFAVVIVVESFCLMALAIARL